MKKLTVILCVICLLSNVVTYASEVPEEKIEKLKGYNIISCYEDGEFCPEKNITRAEFCKMVSVMTGMTAEDSAVTDNLFADVPTNHWANPYVAFCYNQGLISGVSQAEKLYFVDLDENGNEIGRSELFYRDDLKELYNTVSPEDLFAPDDYITYQDALKILVCALGYKDMAEARGGYPAGYLTVAKTRGIINTDFLGSDYIPREKAAEIVYNSLFVPLMVISYEDEEKVEYIAADGKHAPLETLYTKYFDEQ